MNAISRVSDITVSDLAEYLRLPDPTASDNVTLQNLLNVAIDYAKNYTGQATLDAYPDFVYAVLVLVQDMWDTRSMYVDNQNVNLTVKTILEMHSVNLLPNDGV